MDNRIVKKTESNLSGHRKHKAILTEANRTNSPDGYTIKGCNINGHLGQWWNLMGTVRGSRYFEQFDYVASLNNEL